MNTDAMNNKDITNTGTGPLKITNKNDLIFTHNILQKEYLKIINKILHFRLT